MVYETQLAPAIHSANYFRKIFYYNGIDKNKSIKSLIFQIQIGQKDGGLDRPLYWKKMQFGLIQKSVANTKKQQNLLGK